MRDHYRKVDLMRSWMLTLALVAVLAVASACGSDDDDANDVSADESETPTEVVDTPTPEVVAEEDPTATPEPEPTPTEEPETEAEPDPTATPEGDSDPEPSGNGQGSDISGLLLTLDDLPAGWTQTLDEFDDDMDMGDVTDEPFDAPCGIQPIDETYEPVAEADRSFQGTELGPYLSQNVVQLQSSGDAENAMSLMRELFACEEWMETDEFGEEIVYEIAEVPFDRIGDDSFALRLGLSFGDEAELAMFGDLGFEMVFVRRGEYISMFLYIDIFGMGNVDFESLVRTADERLQAGT